MVKVKLSKWQGPIVPEVERVEHAVVVPEVPPLDTARLFGRPDTIFGKRRTWCGGPANLQNLPRTSRYAKFDAPIAEERDADRTP